MNEFFNFAGLLLLTVGAFLVLAYGGMTILMHYINGTWKGKDDE